MLELLKRAYHRTPVYRQALERHESEKQARLQARKAERDASVRRLLADYLDNRLAVRAGPFAGLDYIEHSSGSVLLPKLLGTYEAQLHGWVSDAIQRGYDAILDVGCAEGYYAVGFARFSPASQVWAYDLDPDALALARQLAALNKAGNVTFRPHCTHAELSERIDAVGSALVFCDIEGGELALLDPHACPALRRADLIVECHDRLVPGVTDVLIERFSASHLIELCVDPVRRSPRTVAVPFPAEDFALATDENRGGHMRYLRMRVLAD